MPVIARSSNISDDVLERVNNAHCHYCLRQTMAVTSNIPSPRYYAIECMSRRCGARGPLRRTALGAFRAWERG